MQKHSGGGAKFSRFLSEELIPLIDRSYRTIPRRRSLMGHSYVGLFTAWTLLTETNGLFDRFLIVSPSLWYDERMIFSLEKKLERKLSGRVYLAVGSREGNAERDMVADLERFASALRRHDARSS
ncbi:MAG TPA: alpha/beta hydrolase-fold protein [Thermoanaerobaculia bacterium]|nr:alpha/beta hydrolase-fold protein [Thermoanaerobaculia bacterium]